MTPRPPVPDPQGDGLAHQTIDTPGTPGPPGEPDTEDEAPALGSPSEIVRAHPWITAILAVCTLGGCVAGPILLDESWPLARQIAAGGFLGAWVGITITVTKMIG